MFSHPPLRNITAPVHKVDTIIVSDVHLGSRLSRPEALVATLQRYVFKRLILLGDIFDDLNFGRLQVNHWALLAYLRSLCAPESGVEVVWVEGNHDYLLSRVTRHFLGINIHKRFQWTYGGTQFLALHGHQFDTFIPRHPVITEIACTFYKFLQHVDSAQHRLSRKLKQTSKTWLHMSESVAQGATRYATKKGVEQVFCGHTHLPMSAQYGRVQYHNTGCWTEKPATFITVGDHGVEIAECA